MDIPKNLQLLLSERGWTPERLAVECQDRGTPVSIGGIRQWLSGRSVPGGQSVVILADAFGCTTDSILRGHDLEVVQ